MNVIRLGCLGVLLASIGIVQAQRLEISPFYGYRLGGELEDVDTGSKYSFADAPAYGLFLDVGYTDTESDRDMRVELLWSRQDSSVDFHYDNGLGKVDLTIDQFMIGGVAEDGTERFREYLSAHVGATHYSTDGYGSDTRFCLALGVGGKLMISKNIALRVDFRGFCTFVETEGGFIYYNGVTVASFSGSTIWQGQATAGVSIMF